MSLYAIVGILVCILFVNFTEKEFIEARRIEPERFHVRHEGIYRQLREIRHLLESSNRGKTKSSLTIDDVSMSSMITPRQRRNLGIDSMYVMNVSKLQNASICSYTIEPVGEEFGDRILKNLHHIKCKPNNLGNRCQSNQPHCCIQTYDEIDLSIPGKANEMVTIYTGCVCAHPRMIKAKDHNMKELD
ncbi:hypothetical protein QLX08_003215 [Tetragonisca angustula]|uniref:Uncharacterized protein n=1 Tax=Tetragonisca angustula TaxID=166442 RepID=A0AAW1A7U3_9HYME